MSDEREPRTDLEFIRRQPTSVDGTSVGKLHESVLRSWHIARKVRQLLEQETPAKVILEIMDDLQSADDTGKIS